MRSAVSWVLAVMVMACAPVWAQVGAEDADKDRKDREEFRAACKAAADAVDRHMVRVRLTLKKDRGEEPRAAGGRAWARHYGDVVTGGWGDKRPSEVTALLLDAEGTLLLPDPLLDPRFIQSVTVGPDGAEVQADLHAILMDGRGLLLKARGPISGAEPIAFQDPGDGPILPGGMLEGSLAWVGGVWTAIIDPTGWSYRRGGGMEWISVPMGSILFDDDGRPIGFTLSDRLVVSGGPPWRGKDILSAPLLTMDALAAGREAMRDRLASFVLQVRLDFRGEEAEEGGARPRVRFRRSGRGDDESKNDVTTAGVLIGPGRLLLPIAFDRERINRLSKVTVWVDGKPCEGRFAGALRDHAGVLVDVDVAADSLPNAAVDPGRDSLVLTALVDYESGVRRETISWGRWGEAEQGYKGLVTPTVDGAERPGAMVLDPLGGLLGLAIQVRREDAGDERRYYGGDPEARVLPAALLAAIAADPKAYVDPRLVPLDERMSQRLIWLGVEFQTLDKELAKAHGVEESTRGGEVGLLVTHVYEGSPAAANGVKPGDVLLSVLEEGKDEPWEARKGAGGQFDDFFAGFDIDSIPEEAREMVFAQMPAPWPSRRNVLSERLTAMGVGTTASFRVFSGGEVRAFDVLLDWAPEDFDSAEKHKDDGIGLTVKALTYEVRRYYRIAPDAPGVVVAKVESGSRSAVAKVFPYEVVTEVDGRSVADVASFKAAMEAARNAGTGAVQVRLTRMGKGRLVRINLGD